MGFAIGAGLYRTLGRWGNPGAGTGAAELGTLTAMSACPICQRVVPDGAGSAPFCTPRCKLVDLGNWLEGRYVIPGRDAEDGPLLETDVEVPGDRSTPRA